MANSLSRRQLIAASLAGGVSLEAGASGRKDPLSSLWANPPSEYRPRTRWWWPGSAVSHEGIRQQLREMKARGLAGAEIVVLYGYYEKGGLPFLTPEWCDAVRVALREAQSLGLTMAMVFSPGWDFGSPSVPPEERSKVLAPCFMDLQGPFSYEGPLPLFKDFGTATTGLFEALTNVEGNPADQDRVIAVVGARLLENGSVEPGSLTDLTTEFHGEAGRWRVEEGRWRLTAFRLRYTGQQNSSQNNIPRSWVVDHLSEQAMRRYANSMAERFAKEFGPWLGKTVDSIFSDSFEAVPLRNTILWSNDTLAQFRKRKGYDFTPYLPALWWDAGEMTSRWRYDLNECLHQLALDHCFRPFLDACEKIDVQGRMQPHYRFNEEIIQGAGMAHRAETEVTTARFDTIADPRKATVAGARFYSGAVVSAEAYTFLHRARYYSTPEELKRATDAFLRDGITLFYNHGFLYSEEKDVAPQRDFFAGDRISPWMPWWPYYGGLADYVARCCAIMRQGQFRADLLLYSPQSQVWSQRAIFNIEQRVMRYGDLPKVLLANGYDYDPVNDHLLQTRARMVGKELEIRGHRYKALLLPGITTLPVETMRSLASFAKQGLTVFAMDRLPERACGSKHPSASDAEVRALSPALTHVADYPIAPISFSPQSQPWSPTTPLSPWHTSFLRRLSQAVPPQVRLPGGAQSNGLTFHQRTIDGRAVYFVTNLQPHLHEGAVWFRDARGWPDLWDAMNGNTTRAPVFRELDGGIEVQLRLESWQSMFVVFQAGRPPKTPRQRRLTSQNAQRLEGPWSLEVEGVRFPQQRFDSISPGPWNDFEPLRHFSGTGLYRTRFTLRTKRALQLDLGAVGCVADVSVNGARAGVRWMQPFKLDIPARLLRKGENVLEIRVANTLLAHVQGLREMPEMPPELVARYGKALPADRRMTDAWERDRALSPLPLSGLAGPVTITPYE